MNLNQLSAVRRFRNRALAEARSIRQLFIIHAWCGCKVSAGLCALCVIVLASQPASAQTFAPAVERVAPTITENVISLMAPIMAEPGIAGHGQAGEITVSLTFTRHGRRPANGRCIPALQDAFRRQIERLAVTIPANIRALDSDPPGTMAFVVGDVFGSTADLSGLPIETWWSEARSRAGIPLTERTNNLGFPGLDATHFHSGLYAESNGALVFGEAKIAWNSPYLMVDVRAPATNCWLNFVNQIVLLYVLGIEERLGDDLKRMTFAVQRRASNGISDFQDQSRISTDIGFLIPANLFCFAVLGAGVPVPAAAACASRVAALMRAKDI